MKKEDVIKVIAHDIVENHRSFEVNFKEIDIRDSTDLRVDLDLDSLDIVEIAYFLEEYYQISIPDSSLYGVNTVGELAILVVSLSSSNQPEWMFRY